MIEIFSDFDGTLTNRDTLVLLLDEFASADWYAIEERALKGELDERESLRREMALITADDADLMSALRREIRPAQGLDDLVHLVREKNWKMTVLSGGLIRFSGTLWKEWGYGDIPLYANDHRRDGRGRIEIVPAPTPRIRNRCNHCKRWHLEEAIKRGSVVVYIGDGLTDFCPAEAAHRRYAKGVLLEYLRKKDLDAVPFDSLMDVTEDLKRWSEQQGFLKVSRRINLEPG